MVVVDEEHVVGGTRIGWHDVPAPLRAWAETQLGSPVIDASDERGGFSPGAAARVRCASGARAFVKAVGRGLNERSVEMHRREARIAARLPRSPAIPRLLGTYDDGAWVALLFEEIDGRLPHLPWDERELQRVLDATTALHEQLTPSPLDDLETVVERLDGEFHGWRTLAAGDEAVDRLDEWSRRNLERLADLESHWGSAATGDTLLHGDVRVDNVLVAGDRVVFVDWALACRGAPTFDVVALAPSVEMQGGPPPEDFVARHRPTATAEPGAVDALVAAIAGYFVYTATLPPPPGLPTVRAFQAAQGEVTIAWLRARTGWR